MNPFKVGDRVVGKRPDFTFTGTWEVVSVHGNLVWCKREGFDPCTYHADNFKLAPRTITMWLNVYKGKYGDDAVSHKTRAHADRAAFGCGRIACVPLTVTEGEGLNES